MMFFVWEKNEKSEDVRNENVDVVEVSLLNTLQLLRDEVDKNLEIKKRQILTNREIDFSLFQN